MQIKVNRNVFLQSDSKQNQSTKTVYRKANDTHVRK